ncbi:MAG: PIG-L family deacetylase [Phycisphaerae bacterium]|nr:PIG-L family deacetylase [Phycisphaerae bacterium]
MRVVCLAAHPDDETIGAGGTLLKHRAAGDEISLVVATVAFEPHWSADEVSHKRDECLAAADILGISDVRFLEFRTMHLNTLPAIELNACVAAALADLKPDIVYAPPCDDLNRDHAVLCEAALVTTRATDLKHMPTLYSYEIPTTTRYNVPGRWQPNTYVDVSPVFERKLLAMSQYRTELRELPHPRSLDGLRCLARERGLFIGCEYAETHMLIRQVR